jgi:hypothetical protein
VIALSGSLTRIGYSLRTVVNASTRRRALSH